MPLLSMATIVSLVCAFWMVGSVFTATTAWLIIGVGDLSWRLFVLVCAIPSSTSLAFTLYYLPESPRWLIQKGDVLGSLQALATTAGDDQAIIAELHGKWEPDARVASQDQRAGAVHTPSRGEEKRQDNTWGQLSKLFAPSLRWSTYSLFVMTMAINSGWYGLILWIPSLFKAVGYSEGSIYSSALLVALSNLPGNVLSLYLIDMPGVGRKRLFVGSMLAAGFLALVLGLT